MAEEKMMNSTTVNILLLGGLGLLVYNKFFGKSKEDKKSEVEESKLDELPIKENPLTESFVSIKIPAGYIAIRSTKTIPTVPAGYLGTAVASIKLAIGEYSDDESAIVAGIKRAVTKNELNVMTKTYQVLYKRDLLYDLKDNLSKKELLPIFTYINKLPYYIKGYKKK